MKINKQMHSMLKEIEDIAFNIKNIKCVFRQFHITISNKFAENWTVI